jgi:DNA excision repair protein ERCC-2
MNNYRDVCLVSSKKVGKKLCVEPRSADEVPQLLEQFFSLGRRGGAVLTGVCGGKLAEGIDYKGEALNGVVVVGLPLAAYDEIQKEINGYYTKKYGKTKGMLIAYTLPAINRGLQAAGRVIRSESERGVLLFCDRRFGDDSLGGVNQFLPDWVRGELILADAKEGGDLIKEKVAQWKIEKNPAKPICNDEPARPRSAKPRKPGKRDLRELARSLGLGDSGRKSRAAPGKENQGISGFGQK